MQHNYFTMPVIFYFDRGRDSQCYSGSSNLQGASNVVVARQREAERDRNFVTRFELYLLLKKDHTVVSESCQLAW